jgi:hypothetical protein
MPYRLSEVSFQPLKDRRDVYPEKEYSGNNTNQRKVEKKITFLQILNLSFPVV